MIAPATQQQNKQKHEYSRGDYLYKEPILKRFLVQHQINYCGIAESHTYRNAHLSDSTWIWDPGFECRPTFDQPRPPGGIGVLVDRNIAHSIVHSDKHCMWTRVELQGNNPIFVAECYFPHSSKTVEHTTVRKSAGTRMTAKAKRISLMLSSLLPAFC